MINQRNKYKPKYFVWGSCGSNTARCFHRKIVVVLPNPGLRFGFLAAAFHTTQSHHHGDQLEHPASPAICATMP